MQRYIGVFGGKQWGEKCEITLESQKEREKKKNVIPASCVGYADFSELIIVQYTHKTSHCSSQICTNIVCQLKYKIS